MTSKLAYLEKYLAKPGEGGLGGDSKVKKDKKAHKKIAAANQAFQIRDVSEVLPSAREERKKVQKLPIDDEDGIFVEEHLVAEAQKVEHETSGVRWKIQQHRRPKAQFRKVKEEDDASGKGSDASPPRLQAPRSVQKARRPVAADDDDPSPPRGRPRQRAAAPIPCKAEPGADSDPSPPRASAKRKAGGDGSDLSPPRAAPGRGAGGAGSDLSPPRTAPKKRAAGGADSDLSPPRATQRPKVSGGDSDLSPPRAAQKPKAGGADSDLSPPRAGPKPAAGGDSDLSPPRAGPKPKAGADSDLSPPRAGPKPKAAGGDSDLSPPRAAAKPKAGGADSDLSPPRAAARPKAGGADSDLSPPRAATAKGAGGAGSAGSDLSPPRAAPRRGAAGAGSKVKEEPASDADLSPPRRGAPPAPSARKSGQGTAPSARARHDSDAEEDPSPPRRRPKQGRQAAEASAAAAGGDDAEEEEPARMSSGLRAGLVQGAVLRDEAARAREERRARVEAAPAEETGKGAGTVYRDKSGRKITREEWVEQRQTKRKKRISEYPEQELEWGGGLKQRVTKEEEMAEIERIAAQPFARMEPDAKYLEELRERQDWNDPMRKVVDEDDAAAAPRTGAAAARAVQEAPKKPKPKCPHPPWPNRFNIPPGYRWDGKVRGNQYEKRWLETRNQREFQKQEQYKYEMEEM